MTNMSSTSPISLACHRVTVSFHAVSLVSNLTVAGCTQVKDLVPYGRCHCMRTRDAKSLPASLPFRLLALSVSSFRIILLLASRLFLLGLLLRLDLGLAFFFDDHNTKTRFRTAPHSSRLARIVEDLPSTDQLGVRALLPQTSSGRHLIEAFDRSAGARCAGPLDSKTSVPGLCNVVHSSALLNCRFH